MVAHQVEVQLDVVKSNLAFVISNVGRSLMLQQLMQYEVGWGTTQKEIIEMISEMVPFLSFGLFSVDLKPTSSAYSPELTSPSPAARRS